MPHNPYDSPDVAALYDILDPWGPGDDFYLDLVMAAPRVLDVGCGTGRLLHRARTSGHTGHLTGLDPARAMLEVARGRTDAVSWVRGDLSTQTWDDGFDLVTMTGHAFQELRTDEETTAALEAMRRALAPGGLVAFETRNPAARAWRRWTPDHPQQVTTPDGVRVTDVHDAAAPTPEGLVTFTSTTTRSDSSSPLSTVSTLRFVEADHLDALLERAGLRATERFGDWDRSPLAAPSPEIITLARAR
ncbi:class I SAM-dependent methyltransferase [Nocardiopsis alborubida]|uniref:Class I SAM-dependent methyltransferase n=1 Tax=Nocardiopsis alborubida TaxID=146802 RepID=A0A7X6MAR4_9ACTN|nr:class I SAM-dependent methyltransferase [Nocardiopsis alborubida]NKY97782.1 class I SAM-dependent methyltransferase [Nocardiopsis alborubida]